MGNNRRIRPKDGPASGEDAGTAPAHQQVSESFDLSALSPATTYHYRIVAVNGDGTSFGNDQTFRTLPLAPSIAAESVRGVQSDAVQLSAQINPGGADTTYHFEYGTSKCSATACSSTPIPDSRIGSGRTFQNVSVH